MKFKKSHFWLTKSQRNGIFLLGMLIVAAQIIIYWIEFAPTQEHQKEYLVYDEVQHEINRQKLNIKKATKFIKPFNPSFLTDFKGYQLGLSPDEIDRVLAHRKSDKYINSAKEFQEISKISDSLLKQIEPFFKFPEWVRKNMVTSSFKSNKILKKKEELKLNVPTFEIPVQDINNADAIGLKSIYGIGGKLANRILNYKNRLGGFTFNKQLYEVYYLDSIVVQRILKKYQVLSKPTLTKININTASFKEVLNIVYLDYDLTKKIFEYKDEFAEILSLEELKNIDGFPIDKFDRIALYLSVK